jgi:hypothetical protein
MFTEDLLLTTWRECPQSRLYHEVVAKGDRHARQLLELAAAEWDCLMCTNPIGRRILDHILPHRFSPPEYRTVVRSVSTGALQATLEHIGFLRDHRRVRSNLEAIAFLERLEAVVAEELERRQPSESSSTEIDDSTSVPSAVSV